MMLKNLLCALLLTTSIVAVQAEEAKKEEAPKAPVFQEAGYNFVGASVGFAKPTGSGNGLSMPLRFAYELQFSHALTSNFAIGVFGSRSNGEIVKNSDVDFAITKTGLVFTFNPTYDSFFDVRAGYTFLDVSAKINGVKYSESSDNHPIFISPGAGMILPIVDKIQFLPSLHYTHFFKTDDQENDFNVFDVMATVRYQF